MDETVLIESLFRQINEWKEKAEKWDEHISPGGEYEKYTELVEKAKNWDQVSEFFGHGVAIGELDFIKEKAKKWDECKNIRTNGSCGTWLYNSEYNELKEKAKKWDNYTSGRVVSLVTGEEKEKAKKWDDCGGLDWIKFDEYKEKAKKWDEYANSPLDTQEAKKWDDLKDMNITFDDDTGERSYVSKTVLKILEEKAEKYDNIANSGRGIWKWSDVKEWQEKAKKYDRLKFLVEEH